jgi:L-cysteine/cystine lyase
MAHVDNLRRHFPSLRHVTYLNTGTCGALPDDSVKAMQGVLEQQLQEGRLRNNYFGAVEEVKQAVREQLAVLFQVRPTNFALTKNTTEAINIVLWGLPLQPGDEIVYTDDVHPSALVAMALQKQRRGVVLRRVGVQGPANEVTAAVKAALGTRTRLVVCSHVCFQTGQRLSVEEIARAARQVGAYSLVDGAQGAGAEPIDLSLSPIDFYTLPGQKWLCGPDGTGALYVRSELLSVLDMTFGGLASAREEGTVDINGAFLPATHAKRYEYDKGNLSNWTGLLESLKFLRIQVGWDYAYERIRGLSGYLMDQLLDNPSVTVVTPREARSGIISFHLNHTSSEAFVEDARERNIDLRYMPQHDLVRVCTGFYNSEDDLQRVVNLALKA